MSQRSGSAGAPRDGPAPHLICHNPFSKAEFREDLSAPLDPSPPGGSSGTGLQADLFRTAPLQDGHDALPGEAWAPTPPASSSLLDSEPGFPSAGGAASFDLKGKVVCFLGIFGAAKDGRDCKTLMERAKRAGAKVHRSEKRECDVVVRGRNGACGRAKVAWTVDEFIAAAADAAPQEGSTDSHDGGDGAPGEGAAGGAAASGQVGDAAALEAIAEAAAGAAACGQDVAAAVTRADAANLLPTSDAAAAAALIARVAAAVLKRGSIAAKLKLESKLKEARAAAAKDVAEAQAQAAEAQRRAKEAEDAHEEELSQCRAAHQQELADFERARGSQAAGKAAAMTKLAAVQRAAEEAARKLEEARSEAAVTARRLEEAQRGARALGAAAAEQSQAAVGGGGAPASSPPTPGKAAEAAADDDDDIFGPAGGTRRDVLCGVMSSRLASLPVFPAKASVRSSATTVSQASMARAVPVLPPPQAEKADCATAAPVVLAGKTIGFWGRLTKTRTVLKEIAEKANAKKVVTSKDREGRAKLMLDVMVVGKDKSTLRDDAATTVLTEAEFVAAAAATKRRRTDAPQDGPPAKKPRRQVSRGKK